MELEKFIFRRQPLGSDRFNRRYWWGLAGIRGAVIAEHVPAAPGVLTVSIITDHVSTCSLPTPADICTADIQFFLVCPCNTNGGGEGGELQQCAESL